MPTPDQFSQIKIFINAGQPSVSLETLLFYLENVQRQNPDLSKEEIHHFVMSSLTRVLYYYKNAN